MEERGQRGISPVTDPEDRPDFDENMRERIATIVRPGYQRDRNLGKELIQPGPTIDELFMRTRIRDENEATEIALGWAYLDFFKLEPEKETYKKLLELRTSIKGQARIEYVEYGAGLVAPSLHGVRGDGFRLGKKSNNIGEL